MLNAVITADRSAEARREPRAGVNAPVPLRALCAESVDARLVNISSRGFSAEIKADIRAGARVWLTLPGLPRVNALVVWSRSGRIGGEFAAPIDPLIVFQALGERGGN